MSTCAPVRPVFRDGQRLTAGRLTQALDYLRSFARRTLLAPLSAGVAGGFELDPPFGFGAKNQITISPGMAIDGRGRQLVLCEPRSFTTAQIAAAVGGSLSGGDAIRLSVAMDESAIEVDPCQATSPTSVVENVKFLFERVTLPSVLPTFFEDAGQPNCVEPWQALDGVAGESCRITLGHVLVMTVGGDVVTTSFYRQGVAPRFGVIRNPVGKASLFLGEFRYDFGQGPQAIDGMAINVPTWFTKLAATLFGGPVRFNGQATFGGLAQFQGTSTFTGEATFDKAGGKAVQATWVAEEGKPAAGSVMPSDTRVFLFPGGSGAASDPGGVIPAGFGGVAAVPCQLESTVTIDRSGYPLALLPQASGGNSVKVAPASATHPFVLGLSAGPSYPWQGTTMIPVAVSGVVQAQLGPASAQIQTGDQLKAIADGGLDKADAGTTVVAIAAQDVPAGGGSAFVWVVTPARPFA